MHRKNAIRHLRTTAEMCDDLHHRFGADSPLVAMYAWGQSLEPAQSQSIVNVAAVLKAPAAEIPWNTWPSEYRWILPELGVGKNPVRVAWRPTEWPVWNHAIRRPLRVWSIDGVDADALDALAQGSTEEFRLAAPSRESELEQVRLELAASHEHLRTIRAEFHERTWRQKHKAFGEFPEDHLWNAVDGYLELQDAVRALDD